MLQRSTTSSSSSSSFVVKSGARPRGRCGFGVASPSFARVSHQVSWAGANGKGVRGRHFLPRDVVEVKLSSAPPVSTSAETLDPCDHTMVAFRCHLSLLGTLSLELCFGPIGQRDKLKAVVQRGGGARSDSFVVG